MTSNSQMANHPNRSTVARDLVKHTLHDLRDRVDAAVLAHSLAAGAVSAATNRWRRADATRSAAVVTSWSVTAGIVTAVVIDGVPIAALAIDAQSLYETMAKLAGMDIRASTFTSESRLGS